MKKCKHCGAEIIKIDTPNGAVVCDADPTTYWVNNPTTEIITPNGERIYCRLNGELEKAHGIGYLKHTCFQ